MATKVEASLGHDFTEAHFDNVFIGISGLIGAGKSTLAKALGETLNLPVYYEPVIDNVYLEDFYKDMKKYAFPLQIFLLNKRFKQQQQIIWQGKGGVLDRTIYEDGVFARMLKDSGLMDERDYRTYMELFQNMSNFMQKPNIIVHLDVSPEESFRRIKMRARDCEAGVPLEYLRDLHAAYEVFIKDISRVIPVIKVDYSEFKTAEEMAKVIQVQYAEISNIRNVTFDKILSASSPSCTPDKKKLKAGDDLQEETTVGSAEAC
jgi:deoxyadenosine kinase